VRLASILLARMQIQLGCGGGDTSTALKAQKNDPRRRGDYGSGRSTHNAVRGLKGTQLFAFTAS